MKWIYRLVRKAYNKKIDSTGLALFRISVGIVLLLEVCDIYAFKELLFDKVPFLEPYELDFKPALMVWMISLGCIIVGFYTRLNCILNYVFLLVFLATIRTYEYHMFYAYMGLGFAMMFLPLGNSLSVDRIMARVKNSNAAYTYTPATTVSVIYYYIPVFLVIGLVYADSVLYKCTSAYWTGGLGMWRPAVLPHFSIWGESFALNNQTFTSILGYVTLVFEAIFVFVFWFRPFRVPLALIGFGLHLGIYIFFPIPWFALGVSAVYLLMIPVSWWRKLGRMMQARKPALTFIYDGECPLCNRTRIILSSLDIFKRIAFVPAQQVKQQLNFPALSATSDEDLVYHIHSVSSKGVIRKGINTYIAVFANMLYTFPLALVLIIPGIYHTGRAVYGYVAANRERVRCTDESCAIEIRPVTVDKDDVKIFRNVRMKEVRIFLLTLFFTGIVLLQLAVSYQSGIMVSLRKSVGIEYTPVGNFLDKKTRVIQQYSKQFLGITNHPVFMDGHMDHYNHIIAVTHVENNNHETWLPIIDENGNPGKYIYGPRWVKWTFRVNAPHINPANMEKGIKDFTAYWLGTHGMNFTAQTFHVKVKKIDVPVRWEENFISAQSARPWINAGTATWTNKEFKLSLNQDIEKI